MTFIQVTFYANESNKCSFVPEEENRGLQKAIRAINKVLWNEISINNKIF